MTVSYRAVARVAKAHGNKGEVVTVPVDGLPFLLREGMRVALVPPELKADRWHLVERVRTSEAGQLVGLSGVDDLSASSSLVGKAVLVARSELPEDFELHDPSWLLGKIVVDSCAGELGRIVEVMSGPANDIWAIEGDGKKTLVPVIPEVVRGVRADGAISITMPEEMLGIGDEDGGER